MNAFRKQVDSYDFTTFTWLRRKQKSNIHQSTSSLIVRDDSFTECRNHQANRNRFQETSVRMNKIVFFLLQTIDKLNAS